MSELKCPFCQQELEQDYCDCIMFECHNPKCKHYYDSFIGREELWQELIRTRKALEIAKDTIRHADWFFDGDYNVDAKTMHNEIKCAIKGITALEQKDKRCGGN